jgi:hypothetical protein
MATKVFPGFFRMFRFTSAGQVKKNKRMFFEDLKQRQKAQREEQIKKEQQEKP